MSAFSAYNKKIRVKVAAPPDLPLENDIDEEEVDNLSSIEDVALASPSPRSRKRSANSRPSPDCNVDNGKKMNKTNDDDDSSDLLYNSSQSNVSLIDYISWKSTPSVFFPITSNSVALLLEPGQLVSFLGSCKVRVVYGCADMSGFLLHHRNSDVQTGYEVFSPKCSSLVSVKGMTFDNNYTSTLRFLQNLLPGDLAGTLYARVEAIKDLRLSILIVEDHSNFISKHISVIPDMTNVFDLEDVKTSTLVHHTANLSTAQLILPSSEMSPFLFNTQAESIANDIDKKCSLMVIGARDSGKSSLTKLFLNRFLSRSEKVMYLDCDVGQSEFTTSGLVSLVECTKPLFGPSFCHLSKPVRSFYIGDNSCQRDPTYYLRCIRELYEEYSRSHSDYSLIVNTHGWLTGLGLMAVQTICSIVNPTHIMQLTQHNNHLITNSDGFNLITTENDHFGIITESNFESSKTFFLEPYRTPSHTKAKKYKASFFRSASLAAYFGCGTAISHQPPYSISANDIQIRILHFNNIDKGKFSSINGCLVGLCYDPSFSGEQKNNLQTSNDYQRCDPIYECLGLGIVRAVDLEDNKIFINTPLDLNLLEKVNTLERGTDEIPVCMLVQGVTGEMPYTQQALTKIKNTQVLGSNQRAKRASNRKRLQ